MRGRFSVIIKKIFFSVISKMKSRTSMIHYVGTKEDIDLLLKYISDNYSNKWKKILKKTKYKSSYEGLFWMKEYRKHHLLEDLFYFQIKARIDAVIKDGDEERIIQQGKLLY